MKLLLPEKATQAQYRHFLLHEAEVGQELAHPNIIRIVTVDRDPRTRTSSWSSSRPAT